MAFKILTNGDGEVSLKRIIAIAGSIIMAGALIVTAWRNPVDAVVFITFPLGLTILYAPQLAVTLLKIWKGGDDK